MVHYTSYRSGNVEKARESVNLDTDTIVAQATPPGRGGVGIVRLSGPLVPKISRAFTRKSLRPRYAEYLPFLDSSNSPIDYGIALLFPAPNSFTGEDVLELQGHGGPMVLDLLIKRAIELGARVAQPGEFTQRAFLNNKIDLTQAEAIADLINSTSADAAKSAMRSLSGEFSAAIHLLTESVIELRVFIEAAIDFPDEEIDFLNDESIGHRLRSIVTNIDKVMGAAQQGSKLNEGVRVLILGQPNVGKSSLLNALSGQEVAIVTPIAGTTRDLLKEHILVDGVPIQIIDTAGLRENADLVEQEGIARARKTASEVDHIFYLVDDQRGICEDDRRHLATLPSVPVTVVFNKADLSKQPIGELIFEGRKAIRISAKEKHGLDAFRNYIRNALGFKQSGEGVFLARRRHIDALERSHFSVNKALDIFDSTRAGELIAEELRRAQSYLNEITGEFDNEALLGRIFSSFCIGK